MRVKRRGVLTLPFGKLVFKTPADMLSFFFVVVFCWCKYMVAYFCHEVAR